MGYGALEESNNTKKTSDLFNNVTIGEVVCTNDPHQMGRLRIMCPALGDSPDTKIKNYPWAMYASPFGGINDIGSRGRGSDKTKGPVAYGMWNIPPVGARVLVMCVDGNPNYRVWLGCVFGQYMTHTLPHGRYSYQDKPETEGKPEGPLSSTENPIEPLYSNQTEAFTDRENFEYRSRGADYSIAYLDNVFIKTEESQISDLADDREVSFVEEDGHKLTSNQGYALSRIEPNLTFTSTGQNYDSQTYSWTTPGFHGISMDDRPENCRMRFRTTHGQQIILDDTNERIYISTAKGKTWIEIDEKGNIDIFGTQEISVKAEKDINFNTDKTFRVHAKEGIHLLSEDEVRVHSKGGNGIHMKSDVKTHIESTDNVYIKSPEKLFTEFAKDIHITTDQKMHLHSTQDFHIKTDAVGHIQTGSVLNIKSGGNMVMTAAPDIHLNGPPAAVATAADLSETAFESFVTSRNPDHEPWPRAHSDPANADKDTGNSFIDKPATYEDPNVGKVDRDGTELGRNDKWHR